MTNRSEEAGLPRYPAYPRTRDSGVGWLGEIPAHWTAKRLKFLAPPSTSALGSKPDGVLYVGLEHVESWTGRLMLETQPERVESAVRAFASGNVLLGKLRPYLAKAARPDFDGVCTSELLVLLPAPECTPAYLMYSLLNAGYVHWLDSLTYGSKMPRVGLDQVASSHAPFPPVSEQRAIAAFLDRETAKIGALVAKKERLIELLQEKRAALISRAVTRGLDRSAPMKESGVEWISDIPTHWEVKRLRNLATLTNGHPFDSKLFRRFDGIPLVRIRDLFSTTTEVKWSGDPVPEAALQDEDILIGMDGDFSVSWWTRGPAVLNQRLCCLRALFQRMSQRYLFYCLPFPLSALNDVTYATTVKHLSSLDVLKFRMPCPPLLEQRTIAEYLNRQTAEIDALIGKIHQAITHLHEYRTALISAVVTGKIDIREEAA